MYKIGIGQDSHRFIEGKPLVLGGKTISNHPGFDANSDGDVIYHALCNAIGTAIGFGSLSKYADKMCKDGTTDSSKYLEHIFTKVKEKSLKINNISISIECKTPKIEPLVEVFKQNIAKVLETKPENIGISATSGEGLTDFGKGLGIQALCIVSLVKC